MSFLNHLFGSDKTDDDSASMRNDESACEASPAPITPVELSKLERNATNSVSLSMDGSARTAVSSLIPLAANATQAAQECSMAIVKFPEGVSWADLCVRHSDGWKTLSNFNDNGKFNSMAAIKQAHLQPAAMMNLALQTAAFAVGLAYMNQIDKKLDKLQSGIEAIQRDMERERDAEIAAAYGALKRLVTKFEEYGSTPEKRQAGQDIVEKTLFQADKALKYRLMCIDDFTRETADKNRLSEAEVLKESGRLASMEQRAAVAYQLYIAAQQVGIRLDGNYTEDNLEKDQSIAHDMAESFSICHEKARRSLKKKASQVDGLPFVFADRIEDDYEPVHPILDALHDSAREIQRWNPMRMHEKAMAELEEKRERHRDAVSVENPIHKAAEKYDAELGQLRFVFNEANMLVIKPGSVVLLKSDAEEE